jgi:hypothetical protein
MGIALRIARHESRLSLSPRLHLDLNPHTQNRLARHSAFQVFFLRFFVVDPPPAEEGILLLLRLAPVSRRAGVVGRRGLGGRPYGIVPLSSCGSGSRGCSGRGRIIVLLPESSNIASPFFKMSLLRPLPFNIEVSDRVSPCSRCPRLVNFRRLTELRFKRLDNCRRAPRTKAVCEARQSTVNKARGNALAITSGYHAELVRKRIHSRKGDAVMDATVNFMSTAISARYVFMVRLELFQGDARSLTFQFVRLIGRRLPCAEQE